MAPGEIWDHNAQWDHGGGKNVQPYLQFLESGVGRQWSFKEKVTFQELLGINSKEMEVEVRFPDTAFVRA